MCFEIDISQKSLGKRGLKREFRQKRIGKESFEKRVLKREF